jgi:hypothetical protein
LPPLKKCAFLCGAKTHDKDPVFPERQFIRWAYDPLSGPTTTRGANDWVCERLWVQESTLMDIKDRGGFQLELGKDVEACQGWRKKRETLVEKMKQRSDGLKEKRRAGLKSVPCISIRTPPHDAAEVWFLATAYRLIRRLDIRFGR